MGKIEIEKNYPNEIKCQELHCNDDFTLRRSTNN